MDASQTTPKLTYRLLLTLAAILLLQKGFEVYSRLGSRETEDILRYVFSYLSAFLCLGVGVVVIASRLPSADRNLFFALCTCLAFATGEIHPSMPAPVMLASTLVTLLADSLFPAFFLHFFLVFPRVRQLPQRRTWLLSLYLWTLPVISLRCLEALRSSSSSPNGELGFYILALDHFYTVLCFVLAAMVGGYSYSRATVGEARKLRWMGLASIVGLIPGPLLGTALPPFFDPDARSWITLQATLAPLTLLFPLAFAYPLLYPTVIDIQRFLSRFLATILSAWSLRLLLLLPMGFLLYSTISDPSLRYWKLSIIGVISIAGLAVRGISAETIDRYLFPVLMRERQRLRSLRERILEVSSLPQFRQVIEQGLLDALPIERVNLFLREESSESFRLQRPELVGYENPGPAEPEYRIDPDSSVMALMKRGRKPMEFAFDLPSDLGNLVPSEERRNLLATSSRLLVPIRRNELWEGVITLSEKTNEEAFSAAEKEQLMQLAGDAVAPLRRLQNPGTDTPWDTPLW